MTRSVNTTAATLADGPTAETGTENGGMADGENTEGTLRRGKRA